MTIHLLLVDDEPEFLEVLAKRLVHKGYRVDTALSGVGALNHLDDQAADVVLLDVKMPGLDGLETLRKIKARAPLVEIIMMTAHATVATAVAAIRLGARDYLMKPCEMAELSAKIESAYTRKSDREQKIKDINTRPYITRREKEALIAAIMAS